VKLLILANLSDRFLAV